MKVLLTLILACSLISAPVMLTGCLKPSQQRTTVNTIWSVGQVADASYKAYLDSVIAGTVATNNVPQISQRYREFQAAFSTAVTVAALNTNAPPSVELLNAASQLDLTIKAATQRSQ